MTRKLPREPLIAIIGATGTGKSQLAIELARRFNGEIINGDAMQLYAGLPIITNKATIEEQKGIPHHLLGCIGLQEPTWVVGMFVNRALTVIEEIRRRGKLPILVSGTHFYTQSLLFRDSLVENDADSGEHAGIEPEEERMDLPILQQSTEILLAELQKVDPVMAERWHPRDRRKIQRSLEIYIRTGRTAAEMYAQQRRLAGTESVTPTMDDVDGAGLKEQSMRFDTLIFWVHAEKSVLRERLDARVDKMLEAGLLEEVRTLDAYAQAEAAAGRPVDKTRGIWVSIGYKEFKEYMHAVQTEETSEKDLEYWKNNASSKTKDSTRQYAKRQIRWIRSKLINSLPTSKILYLLDGTDVSTFDSAVVGPTVELTSSFLAAVPMPEPSSLSSAAAELLQPARLHYDDSAPSSEKWTKQHCEVCNVTCVVESQWGQHMGSKAHKKAVSKRRQRDREAYPGPVLGVREVAEGQESGEANVT
ncbi:tRNA dimethylallyltransferase, mitochondrial [Friedmanniomyces endolithicus]|uniref:tRNA dimethylallyltransferase n=1 Tax=Friedmanniomyces endolithicus TaxID=329885 RepID=A0AAN6FV51_9PEZI|nr:tRNA dimethylallyltransferase, mitochondrial [Friedmanniomyces endolithicus]KAK0292885.1 tRNA dimethylallyltransferase, mitochondrial [Friedmanniomyces endolithicus]KAK0323396.1 tRNA dimethylallyltransferase, mitochondrial [Friedmanniomyces endolithicus]KAK1013466.1 tRNA dimethylallyltransferase, mitochondrial [Friedmanniomyces endolithicus]